MHGGTETWRNRRHVCNVYLSSSYPSWCTKPVIITEVETSRQNMCTKQTDEPMDRRMDVEEMHVLGAHATEHPVRMRRHMLNVSVEASK